MLSKIATVTALAASVMANVEQYGTTAPPTKKDYYATTTYVETTTVAAVEYPVYYEDYDQLLAAGGSKLYYAHAMTKESAEKRKLDVASATGWSDWKPVEQNKLKNAKGVTFCGAKDDKYNHYGQVFVADEDSQKVYAWDWAPKEGGQPWEAALKGDAWVAYDGEAAAAEIKTGDPSSYESAPTDVQCGPDGGIFIADKGNNAIYWVNGADVAAKKLNKATPVFSQDCGKAVADVRSLAYNADTNTLTWSNDAAVAEEKGVFSYNFKGGIVKAAACQVDACNNANWDQNCNADIKKANFKFEAADKVWAVENKGVKNDLYVSTGKEDLYKADAKAAKGYAPYAEVGAEVTTVTDPHDPHRPVVFAVDQAAGQVYAVTDNGDAKELGGKTQSAYAVAYNDAYGWEGELKPLENFNSAASLSVAVGAVLAVVAALL